jgi:hypothetical protein
MAARAVAMYYVSCPNPACSDPVGGRIPQAPEELKLTCANCKQTFRFEPNDVKFGLVSYHQPSNRWRTEGYGRANR